MYENKYKDKYNWRLPILSSLLFIALLGLFGRILYLGIIKHKFLLGQSNMRSVRDISMPAHRGMIIDRNGKPLAISIPVASIWVNPKIFNASSEQITQLSNLLDMPIAVLYSKITKQKHREFIYLKRSVPSETAAKISELHITGIAAEKSYKRYYSEADAMAQVVGFTNIDDIGQEGLELAYDSWLRGTQGKMRVVKDCLGNIITNLGIVAQPKQGHDLVLSIDRRIQYLAYQELKKTIDKYNAEYGSVVVLKVKTGEILAMANFPSYNPNNREGVFVGRIRNKAITDMFEPGSTIKALTIANALNSGKYTPDSIVDTGSGRMMVDGHLVHEHKFHHYGAITVTDVLKKSSNVGVTKMTLSLPNNSLPNLLKKIGFGASLQSGFPGETAGFLPDCLHWRPHALATLAFGYSVSVSLLHIAQAYSVVASYGLMRPVTFLKNDSIAPGKQVLSEKVCRQILTMLETVLDIGGTGRQAQIPGYRVAGKTGTAHIAKQGGYYTDRFFATFAGIAPVSDPQIVIAVMIKDPRGAHFEGGMIAAPVFANIMNGTLRILGIAPDAKESI